jgi:ABC-type lipoprotein release transport system permease subunit
MMPNMRAAWYYWRSNSRRMWRSMVVVALLCGILGAAALAALAGARRTESAYGRYLVSINSSDVYVNVPSPDTALDAKVAALPGIASSSVWLGLNANPVVHGRVDNSFVTDGFAGSVSGELFTQDRMTVVAGHLPRLDSSNEICLTAGLARLFGVHVGGHVTYQFENSLSLTNAPTGFVTYRVAAIVELPPALVDQFDQVQSAVIPPAATAAALVHRGAVAFSWVGVRLRDGSAGVGKFDHAVSQLAARVANGYTFAIRQLDLVHQQVQEAIRPQAFAIAAFGAFAVLALIVLVGQALSQLLEASTAKAGALQEMGLRRTEVALACGLGGAEAVIAGIGVAIGCAAALSPLGPVGPVRAIDPARGFQFDATVLVGGGATMLVLLLALTAWISWHAVKAADSRLVQRFSAIATTAVSLGLPATAALGASYALGAAPGRNRMTVRANVLGSAAAVTAVVTAVVFAASLNGLITHPSRYGWNWSVLMQSQGGYGSFLPNDVNTATIGNGDGPLDHLLASTPGIRGWSTFGFTQLLIDGQQVPVLGVATHGGDVEPPTVSGRRLSDTEAEAIGSAAAVGPDGIELGRSTLRQLGKQVADRVEVGTGPTARRLTVVGVVTLPSIGVTLSDHVSLGRGAMLAESTLLSIMNLSALNPAPAEAFSALPSTIAIDIGPHADPVAVVRQIVAALNRDGADGGVYEVPRVVGAAIVNAGQMGGQPVTLAIALALAVLVSLSATVVAATRRRRHELAVLKALGLRRRQMRSIVVSQTLTLLVVALLLGIPLGIAGGHWAWATFASSLGVVPVTAVPAVTIVVGVVGVLVGGMMLAAVPAAVAARTPTTAALRAE